MANPHMGIWHTFEEEEEPKSGGGRRRHNHIKGPSGCGQLQQKTTQSSSNSKKQPASQRHFQYSLPVQHCAFTHPSPSPAHSLAGIAANKTHAVESSAQQKLAKNRCRLHQHMLIVDGRPGSRKGSRMDNKNDDNIGIGKEVDQQQQQDLQKGMAALLAQKLNSKNSRSKTNDERTNMANRFFIVFIILLFGKGEAALASPPTTPTTTYLVGSDDGSGDNDGDGTVAEQKLLFFKWLHFRNATHFSPISPANPDGLEPLSESAQWENNGRTLLAQGEEGGGKEEEQQYGQKGRAQQRDDAQNGNGQQRLLYEQRHNRLLLHHRRRHGGGGHRRLVQQMDPDAPFVRRAICPFQFVLNHRVGRVPATLVEVQCLSECPSRRLLGRPLALVECEPMRWDVRVLMSLDCASEDDTNDGGTNCWRPAVERIALGCVPVLQAHRREQRAEEDNNGGIGTKGDAAELDSDDDRLVPVPANPVGEMVT